MDLVVDASVLVAELSRPRGHRLLSRSDLSLVICEEVWSEVRYEFPARLLARVRHGRLTADAAESLLLESLDLIERFITILPVPIYGHLEDVARRRVPRDPRDWPTVALALALNAGIWTADADFLGCGVPTWTTETLLLHVPV